MGAELIVLLTFFSCAKCYLINQTLTPASAVAYMAGQHQPASMTEASWYVKTSLEIIVHHHRGLPKHTAFFFVFLQSRYDIS